MNDIGIKIRNYKLENTLTEFCNPRGNREVFDKIDTGQNLNLYIDRDIFLSEKAATELGGIFVKHFREKITPNLIAAIEEEYKHFFKCAFSSDNADFHPTAEKRYSIKREYYFNYY